MGIDEMVRQLNQGKTLRQLAAELGTNHGNLLKKLQRRGYKRINNQYTKEGEPMEQGIPKVIPMDDNPHPTITHVKSTPIKVTHPQLTPMEVLRVKEIIQEYDQWKQSVIPVDDNLFDRVKNLSKEPRKRKTVLMKDSLFNQFDAFCEAQGLNKTDLLELALVEFISKHKQP